MRAKRKEALKPPPAPHEEEALDQLLKELDDSFVSKKRPVEVATVEEYEKTEGIDSHHLEESAFKLGLSENLISEEAEHAYSNREERSSRMRSLLNQATLRDIVLFSELMGRPRGE